MCKLSAPLSTARGWGTHYVSYVVTSFPALFPARPFALTITYCILTLSHSFTHQNASLSVYIHLWIGVFLLNNIRSFVPPTPLHACYSSLAAFLYQPITPNMLYDLVSSSQEFSCAGRQAWQAADTSVACQERRRTGPVIITRGIRVRAAVRPRSQVHFHPRSTFSGRMLSPNFTHFQADTAAEYPNRTSP